MVNRVNTRPARVCCTMVIFVERHRNEDLKKWIVVPAFSTCSTTASSSSSITRSGGSGFTITTRNKLVAGNGTGRHLQFQTVTGFTGSTVVRCVAAGVCSTTTRNARRRTGGSVGARGGCCCTGCRQLVVDNVVVTVLFGRCTICNDD